MDIQGNGTLKRMQPSERRGDRGGTAEQKQQNFSFVQNVSFVQDLVAQTFTYPAQDKSEVAMHRDPSATLLWSNDEDEELLCPAKSLQEANQRALNLHEECVGNGSVGKEDVHVH